MSINFIDEQQFDPAIHINYKKWAQVSMRASVYGRLLPTITWIFYCNTDADPAAILRVGEDCRFVDCTGLPIDILKLGYVLDPADPTPNNTNFLNPEVVARRLHTDDEITRFLRVSRNAIIASCDWLVSRHLSQPENAKTLTEAQYAELQGYMQALRDFPANVDLDNIVWPPKPAFMA